MDGYTYTFDLNDGRSITVNSFDPLDPDQLRDLKKRYEGGEKGSIFRAPEHLARRFYGGWQKGFADAYSSVILDNPIAKMQRMVPEYLAKKAGIIEEDDVKLFSQQLRGA